jgi:hypothetical protein
VSTYDWFPKAVEFMDLYGIPREVVQAAADDPTSRGLNEDSGKDGWVIEDRRRGDVTAIVGMKPDVPEAIMYVRIFTGDDFAGQHRTAGGGHKEAPKTHRGVRARIVADGFTIQSGRFKDRILDRHGEVLMGYDPKEPATVMWGQYRRVRDRYRIGERVGLGDLLTEWGGARDEQA